MSYERLKTQIQTVVFGIWHQRQGANQTSGVALWTIESLCSTLHEVGAQVDLNTLERELDVSLAEEIVEMNDSQKLILRAGNC